MDDVCIVEIMDIDLAVISSHRMSSHNDAIDTLLRAHFAGYVVSVKWRMTGEEQQLADTANRLEGIADSRPGQISGWDVALIVLDPENRRRAQHAQNRQRQLEYYREELAETERSLRSRLLRNAAERDVK